MQLYTLFATPGQTADFVMVASLRTIENYLGRQVPRTFGSIFDIGEHPQTMAPGIPRTQGRVGFWKVCEGAHLPLGTMVGEA